MSYAIIETGGKQYKVSPGDEVFIEKLDFEAGDKIKFDKILTISNDGNLITGEPYIKGASVSAKLIKTGKAKKIIVFKMRRRKGYRRKQGHRQPYSKILIEKISAPGVTITDVKSSDSRASKAKIDVKATASDTKATTTESKAPTPETSKVATSQKSESQAKKPDTDKKPTAAKKPQAEKKTDGAEKEKTTKSATTAKGTSTAKATTTSASKTTAAKPKAEAKSATKPETKSATKPKASAATKPVAKKPPAAKKETSTKTTTADSDNSTATAPKDKE